MLRDIEQGVKIVEFEGVSGGVDEVVGDGVGEGLVEGGLEKGIGVAVEREDVIGELGEVHRRLVGVFARLRIEDLDEVDHVFDFQFLLLLLEQEFLESIGRQKVFLLIITKYRVLLKRRHQLRTNQNLRNLIKKFLFIDSFLL